MERFCRRMTGAAVLCWLFILAWYAAGEILLPETFTVREGEIVEISGDLFEVRQDSETVAQASAVRAGNSYNATVYLLDMIPLKTVRVSVEQPRTLIPGGFPFGAKMFSDGVLVVGFTDVISPDGKKSNPGEAAGLKMGDIILRINGIETESSNDIAKIIRESSGEPVRVTYLRGGLEVTTTLIPQRDSGGWKAGMWLRDSSAGIGTVTYLDPATGIIAGLGHGITDPDTGVIMPVGSGEMMSVTITNVIRAQVGDPGELRGVFGMSLLGTLVQNTETGVYGIGRVDFAPYGQPIEVAYLQEIECGRAMIVTTLDREGPKCYEIEIESVSLSERNPVKNMVIRVVDEELLEKTGGIVQGMSGSPILQNGRIIGAVTHVFINDPTRGYGIGIENMLKTAETAERLAA